MDLKSFFDLEKVIFSKEELEDPYEDELTDLIFLRDDNLYKKEPIDVIFNKNDLQ